MLRELQQGLCDLGRCDMPVGQQYALDEHSCPKKSQSYICSQSEPQWCQKMGRDDHDPS